ncbi:protein MEMO1 isoform X3 [Mesocricetus auratus]|nr:protein MEMO1 isoform X3 [Mesocricetus auratus]
MSNRVVCREASHAGSWYTASGPQLNAQLEGWLSQVQSTKRPARAIIAPHAGYTYCGSCAAHAYKQVDPAITRRIFILGPSHHVPLSRCALSSVDIYRTPLYDLRIDQKIYGELWKTGMFERMSLQTDEDEHSIEMHLPYTAKAMESHKDEFTIIPVLVGALSESKEQEFGKLFSKYLADPSNLFVVSSDFCHWESVLWNGFTNELPSFPQRVRFLLYRIFFSLGYFSSHLLNLKRTEGRHLKNPLRYSLGSSRACPAPRAVSMALKARKLILEVETGAQRIHFPSVPSERISFRSKVPLQLL